MSLTPPHPAGSVAVAGHPLLLPRVSHCQGVGGDRQEPQTQGFLVPAKFDMTHTKRGH